MDALQYVLSLQRDDQVSLYYDVARSKVASYRVVSVDVQRQQVVYQSLASCYRASAAYVASVLASQ